MPYNTGTTLTNSIDGYVTDANQIKGGYVPVSSYTQIPFEIATVGMYVYSINDSAFYLCESVNKDTKIITWKKYLGNDAATVLTDIKNCIPTKASSDNKLATAQDIDNINKLLPSNVSDTNKLVDYNTLNNAISENTANYISKNNEPFNSLAELQAYSGVLTNNDYAWIKTVDETTNIVTYSHYKYNSLTASWAREYDIVTEIHEAIATLAEFKDYLGI